MEMCAIISVKGVLLSEDSSFSYGVSFAAVRICCDSELEHGDNDHLIQDIFVFLRLRVKTVKDIFCPWNSRNNRFQYSIALMSLE